MAWRPAFIKWARSPSRFLQGGIPIAKRTDKALKDAAIVKTLSKRSAVALCIHGINKKYCNHCAAAKKSSKAAAAEDSE
jgi:hypothetical protein